MRNLALYPKLAAHAIRVNARFYLPYLITCTVAVALHYDVRFLGLNSGVEQMPGGSGIQGLLAVVALAFDLFSGFLFFYANGFLMKQRQKELGLYSILGMGKRHIRKLIRWETLYTAIIAIGGGVILGICLSRVFLNLFAMFMQVDIPIGFEVSSIAIVFTVFVYIIVFAIILVANLGRVSLAKPIELVRGTSTGDREPRTKWLTAICGVLALAGGYLISFLTNPFQDFWLFVTAVLLVIIATYCLFSAGSIAFLNRLRANKAYYYQSRHFFAVAQMLHRMKRNATGLATICILSTMTLVVSSTTLCMFLGAGAIAMQAGDPELRSLMCAYFFVGLFLSALFLMSSALTLYYKQLSEGAEDASSFRIMQQVGMTDDEVRGAMRGQASLVFLPPLAIAACHTAAALPMTSKVLMALGITDFGFIVSCYVISLLAYAALYLLVYLVTSRTYYRLVSGIH